MIGSPSRQRKALLVIFAGTAVHSVSLSEWSKVSRTGVPESSHRDDELNLDVDESVCSVATCKHYREGDGLSLRGVHNDVHKGHGPP